MSCSKTKVAGAPRYFEAVRAIHITQLRTAINQVRAGVGQAGYAWQYSATTNDWISANPILEMRTALDQALGAPSPAYAAGLALGQPIKAVHIQELRNRVTAALAGQSSSTLSQYYDGGGLRVKKTENGATTWYLRSSVLGGQVVAEMNGSAGWQRGFVYAGSSLLAVQQGGVFWMHEDPVTKSKRVTDSGGTVVSTIETDPWGADTNRSSNAAFQPKKFTSYDRDANGSDEAMFRRFNRKHSRFDQPDPYDGSYNLGDPQSFNRYAYVNNDPVNFIDPSGLNLEEPDHRWSATDGINPMGFMGPGIHLESNREGFIIQRWIVFGPFGQSPQNPAPTRLQNAIDLARAALSRDSCKKLFGTGIDPVKLLNDLASGTAGIGSIRTGNLSPASTNAQTTGILGSRTITNAQGQQIRQSIFTGANITINSNSGAAFQAGYGSRFGVSDEINRAITLIHELGHAANIIFAQHSSGIMNDEGPLGGIASDMNSERVFRDCFEMYPSTYGGGQ